MFYRKLFAYLLLALYGVPAAIGPHWHSHDRCADAESIYIGRCCSHADSDKHSPHDPPAATNAHHGCKRTHHAATNHEQAESKSPATSLEHNSHCDNCSICHFYACTPFSQLDAASGDLHALIESIPVADFGQLRRFEQLHLARGPPTSFFIS